MRRYTSTGSARSAKLAEGSARGATVRKIGWLRRALPGSPYSPGRKRPGFFLSSGGKTSSKTFFVAVCNVSLQLAGGLFTFLLRRCRKGRRPSRFFWLRAHSSGRFSEGDADAKIETPFLRFRGRHGFGRHHAFDGLPSLGSSSAASAGRSSRRRSRRFGRSRQTRSRSGRTPRSRFRSASPLRAHCYDGLRESGRRSVGRFSCRAFLSCAGAVAESITLRRPLPGGA